MARDGRSFEATSHFLRERYAPMSEPNLQTTGGVELLPTRQVWVARDVDGWLGAFPSHPVWNGNQFEPCQPGAFPASLPDEWFPDIEPGFCQAFVRFEKPVDCRG